MLLTHCVSQPICLHWITPTVEELSTLPQKQLFNSMACVVLLCLVGKSLILDLDWVVKLGTGCAMVLSSRTATGPLNYIWVRTLHGDGNVNTVFDHFCCYLFHLDRPVDFTFLHWNIIWLYLCNHTIINLLKFFAHVPIDTNFFSN